ncbi:sensor histidine kinase [Lacrimispora sp. JR3]|uniref:sensor histidine kinase n=1 Tax=Lacrimispora sinapis TaxID=3111456 RepID=UPI0037494EDD
MTQKRKSIFFNLTISFIVLGAAPLLIAGSLLFIQFRNNMERVVLDDMTRMVRYSGNNVQEMVDECSELTKRIYDISTDDGLLLYQVLNNRSLRQEVREMKVMVILNEMLDGDTRIRTAYFEDNQGRVYYATKNTQKVLDKKAFLKFIAQEDDTANFSVLYTHVDSYFPDSRNQVVTFRRSYQDITSFKTIKNSLGNLYLDMDISKLSSMLSDVSMDINESFRIVDERGRCIYSMEPSETGSVLEEMLPLYPVMSENEGMMLKGNRYLVYDRLENCGWTVVAQAGRDRVLQNLESTKQYILAFLGGTFFLLLCLYFYFLKEIRKPVKLLERGMAEIQKGNLETRIDVGGREDEIGVLASGLNSMAKDLNEYIKKVYVAEIGQREAELNALKSQIKPHYLYNTLEVIRMTALEQEDRETARMVESLSRQLKYLMGHSGDMVPLRMEIENIREYFYIMRIRYENRIQLEVSVDEEVMETPIIKLSLQPIVENAVKHGLRPKKGKGTVRIEAHKRRDCLEVTVMDDGVGMNEEILKALQEELMQEEVGVKTREGLNHVGIKNVYDRIQKNFGPEYGLEIISTEGTGTIVVYTLPVNAEES